METELHIECFANDGVHSNFYGNKYLGNKLIQWLKNNRVERNIVERRTYEVEGRRYRY